MKCPYSCFAWKNFVVIVGADAHKGIYGFHIGTEKWNTIGSFPETQPNPKYHSACLVRDDMCISVDGYNEHITVFKLSETRGKGAAVKTVKPYAKGSKDIQITETTGVPCMDLFRKESIIICGSSVGSSVENKQITIYKIGKDNHITRQFYQKTILPIPFRWHHMCKTTKIDSPKGIETVLLIGGSGGVKFNVERIDHSFQITSIMQIDDDVFSNYHEMHNFGMVCGQECMVIIGGKKGHRRDTISALEFSGDKWSDTTLSVKLSKKLSHIAAVADKNNRIHIIGGTDGESHVKTHYIYESSVKLSNYDFNMSHGMFVSVMKHWCRLFI